MALIQARDQGQVRTMVERSLRVTAMSQERAVSPDWNRKRKASGKSIQLNKRSVIDS